MEAPVLLSENLTVPERLKALEVGDAISTSFPIDRYRYIALQVWKLKNQGYRFTMRKINDRVYVWRLA